MAFITFSAVYTAGSGGQAWLFPELGPAVMQDSYFGRSPGLESPFGIIGDLPGGYSLYSGNPLQTIPDWDFSEWFVGQVGFALGASGVDLEPIIMAVLFGLVPLALVLLLGRKSYGSTKTQ
jgi:hypothetical protein